MINTQDQQCLYCYQPLTAREQDFHPACSKKFFGTSAPALFPFDKSSLEQLSKGMEITTTKGTSLQAGFLINIEKKIPAQSHPQFTIIRSGHFIFKPPVDAYPFLPELQDLTMHLASIARIKTAPHSLIRLQSGELAYISRRTDRTKKGKLPKEDMCQLSRTLTEYKYQGSMEKIGKIIHAYSSNPGLDVISFFELSLFCFLTGNAHMHLKSFSLLTSQENNIGLSPADNLVPSKLLLPDDKEETALSLNGKKRNLKKSDFDSLAEKLKINAKTLENTYKRFQNALSPMLAFTDLSFLSEEMKQNYKNLIKQRAHELFGHYEEETTNENLQEIPDQQIAELINESAENLSSQQYPDLIDVPSGVPEKIYQDPLSRQLSLFPI